MTYRLGIDVGSTHTTWATVSGGADGTVESGSIESVLGVAADGQLVGGTALAGVGTFVRDFVPRLGDSAPVMVGTTPYGAEALVARLVGTVLDTARARHGGDPLAVVMVHDDGLDPYRSGLLGESARLAGLAPAATVLLSRSEAAAAAGGGASAAAGAAKAGWQRVPDPEALAGGGAGSVALGTAGGVAAAGAGVAAAASILGDGAAATASAAAPVVPAAGPAGAPIAPAGPAGTPLAPAGPAGTPLTPAGPAGTPLQPTAGPGGTPLQPTPPAAGPSGAPIQPSAGPGGTPLQPPAGGPAGSTLPGAATPTVPVTTGIGVPKPRIPKWVTITAGAVVVAAVGVGVAVVVNNDDSPSTTLGDSTKVVETTVDGGSTPGTDGGSTDTTTGGGSPGETVFDLAPILGTWTQPCEPYLSGDGASHGTMTVQSPGTNRLDVVIAGGDFVTGDCTGDYTETIAVTYPLTVVGAGTAGDVQAFLVEPAGDPTCTSLEQGACDLAMGMSSSMPPAIGVDASGQLVAGDAGAVDANGFPTSWTAMADGSVRS